MRRKHYGRAVWALVVICLLHVNVTVAQASGSRVQAFANAITELDIERANQILDSIATESPGLSFQRARLAVYTGNCDAAEATLATVPETPETSRLSELARNCARATAGSLVQEDKAQGVWIRLQDAGDKALVPRMIEVAVRARESMVRELGVELPRPLRIDLVRDLFSLASVSGLPVEAAETTGTVAVARWGRVTMLTPRAARLGYPWEDTLAHEITHLALTRGSRDFAPLWLQEGIAKRQEDLWREKRPFDDRRNPHQISRQALLDGKSVGIDRIGPSIAMLPTPEAASISYAEVESFMDFWIRENGRAAFTLLLLDMKGLGTRDADKVQSGVTGYPLRYWIARWQEHLRGLEPAKESKKVTGNGREVVRSVRLGDMLDRQGHGKPALGYFDQAILGAADKPAVRFRAAAAAFKSGQNDAAAARLGNLEALAGLHGGWLGLHGRLLRRAQQANQAEQAFGLAVAVDPLGEEAACEGHGSRSRAPDAGLPAPLDVNRQKLCAEARQIVRD